MPAPQSSPAPEPSLKLERVREIPLPTAVLALDVSPDGSFGIAACQGGDLQRIDFKEATVQEIGRHASYASGVALTPDLQTVISSSYDGTLRWNDLKTRAPQRSVQAHHFWSWGMDLSADGRWLASCTGQYSAAGYKYEPGPEREPSVRIYNARTGEWLRDLPHVPPTQSVAFSPDGTVVAAGNLMGEIRIWEVESGRQIAAWTTPDLTSWGIIKSHHYLGGIFAMTFNPKGDELYVCGMGPMVDPMAGNGVQRWQRFDWRTGKKLDQTHEGESGQGLMEALAFHPTRPFFVMAGRLFQGQWNLALFDSVSGKNLVSTDAKHRITDVTFSSNGEQLFLAKAKQQEKPKDGKWPPYGQVEIWKITTQA